MVLPLRRWIALVSDCVCGAKTGGLEGNFMVVKIHDGRKFHGGQDPFFGNLGYHFSGATPTYMGRYLDSE